MAATGLFALHRARIARAVAHLERHLDARPATAAELAEVAGLSEFHFHRVFRAVVGESVIAHARRLRLERAARRLRGDERRIVEVALEAGFDSHEGFTRAFTGLFGVPPARYRSESPPAPAPSPPDSFARVEVRPPERALALRHVGPYGGVGAAWGALIAEAAERGVVGATLGLCHDDPEVTEPARFRYDACLITAAEGWGPVRAITLPGGRFVVATHHGPYEAHPTTYGQLLRWALDRDLPIAPAPSRERYLDTPDDALRTAVALPIDDGGPLCPPHERC